MTEEQLRSLLEDVRSGATDIDSALERVREGITTLREANKVTFIE